MIVSQDGCLGFFISHLVAHPPTQSCLCVCVYNCHIIPCILYTLYLLCIFISYKTVLYLFPGLSASQFWRHGSPAGIVEGLKGRVAKMKEGDKLLVWYSGHAKHYDKHRTLIRPEADEQNKSCTTGLWLECWLLENVLKKREVAVWCVIAACRDRIKELDHIINERTLHRFEIPSCDIDLSTVASMKDNFMCLYACDTGESIWDVSIFAKAFCYELRRQPKSIQEFQLNMSYDCQVLSFGGLTTKRIPQDQENVGLFTQQRDSREAQEDKVDIVDPKFFEAIKRFPLIAIHLQQLTDSDISNDDVKTYIRAKKDASDILHRFKDKEERFKDLRQQIWILSRSNLQEVLGVLEQPPESIPSPTNLSDLHTVNDGEKKDDLALLNLPNDVIHVIGEALAKCRKDRKEFPVEQFRRMLTLLGRYYTGWNFKAESWHSEAQDIWDSDDRKEVEHYLILHSSNVEDLNDSESEELVETIETDCQEVGIEKEQLKIIMGRSSLWLILISRVKLDAERLKRVVEQFLEKQRKKSLAWAFATAPSEAPAFAAPGLWRAVGILEELRGIVGIPRVVCLRSCDFKKIAQQLLAKLEENMDEWQVRVVTNNRDLKDGAWLSAQGNEDLRFCTSEDWQTFRWKDTELPKKLQEVGRGKDWSNIHALHATAYLCHALQENPQELPLDLASLTKKLFQFQDPRQMFKALVQAIMDLPGVRDLQTPDKPGASTKSGSSTGYVTSSASSDSSSSESLEESHLASPVVQWRMCLILFSH